MKTEMGNWLIEVRSRFNTLAPDLLTTFEIYAAEAIFGRSYIAANLAQLQRGAKILEVGAGSLLLSCQLVREGFNVSALEPIGDGFSHFDRMRQIVLDASRDLNCTPAIIDLPAEELSIRNCFDFAFSVNVMEHVRDVSLVIKNVGESLAPGADYRFTCPNYLFPYEPHFNIPTFFSKRLTKKFLRRKILENHTMADPVGTWASLNWINVSQVKQCIRQQSVLELTFNRAILPQTLKRIATDETFARRRSPAIRTTLLLLIHLRLHHIFNLIPTFIQPIMDCNIKKINQTGTH